MAAAASPSGAEGAVEAVGHVHRHLGSSQLAKRLGIQHQEEGGLVLREFGGGSFSPRPKLPGSPEGLPLGSPDHAAVVWANYIPPVIRISSNKSSFLSLLAATPFPDICS